MSTTQPSSSSRYSWARRTGLLFLPFALSCTEPPTALVLVVSEENAILEQSTQVTVLVKRGEEIRFQQDYPTPPVILGTLTLNKSEDASADDVIVIRVAGTDYAGNEKVFRQARLGFVEGKTKILRMPLRGNCLNVTCDSPDQTCDDLGKCSSDFIDVNTLPDFVNNEKTLSEYGVAGSAGQAGTAGTGGSAALGGTAGTGGAAASGGTAGSAGMGATGGIGGTAGSAGTSGSAGSGASGAAGTAGTAGTGGSLPTDINRTVALGFGVACAVENGIPFCWGNAGYIVGDYSYPQFPLFYDTPVRLTNVESVALAPISSVMVSPSTEVPFACAIYGANREVVCWGDNESGQTGVTETAFETPHKVTNPEITNVAEIALAGATTCVRLEVSGNNVSCWGNNDYFLLGASAPSTTPNPQKLTDIVDAAVLRASLTGACVLAAGEVQCWGGAVAQQYLVKNVPFVAPSDIAILERVNEFRMVVFSLDSQNNVTWSVQDSTPPFDWSTPAAVVDASGTPLGSVSMMATGSGICGVSMTQDSVRCIEFDVFGPISDIVEWQFPGHTITELSHTTNGVDNIGSYCVRLEDSTVQCWGDNRSGQTGAGVLHIFPEPTSTMSLNPQLGIFSGLNVTATIDSAAVVTSWGTSSAFWNDNLPHAAFAINSVTPVLSSGTNATIHFSQKADRAFITNGTEKVVFQGSVPVANPTDLFGSTLSFIDASPADVLDLGISADTPNFVRGFIAPNNTENSGLMQNPSQDADGIYHDVGIALANLAYAPREYNVHAHACVRGADESVWCWGYNGAGQCGVSNGATPITAPTQALPQGSASMICTGDHFSCASLTSVAGGSGVKCWGENNYGQVDFSQQAQSVFLSPTHVPNVPLVDGVTCGKDFACAWNTTQVYCWGDNSYGQLGNATIPRDSFVSSLVAVQNLAVGNVAAVAAGDRHACVLYDTGAIDCWGSNDLGQCGQSEVGTQVNPTTVVFPLKRLSACWHSSAESIDRRMPAVAR